MSVQPNPIQNEYLTPEEYLERERKSEFRSEYRGNGVIVAMSGASRTHNRIAGNQFALIWTKVRGSSCDVYMNDMKVRLPGTLRYVYPDIVVSCQEEFQDEREDILTNPTLIIEVLSDSTESYDRGEKWAGYQRIPSLREYILVTQNRAVLERFVRQGDLWLYSRTEGLESVLTLEAVSLELRLRDVYENVSFPVLVD
jgi:Uma2 family endonuclease